MVTIAEEFNILYPADITKPIFLKGFVYGNHGMFNRHWFNTTSANIKPGMGVLRATGGAEHTVTEWGQHCLVGYGVPGWDRTQIATQQTTYAQYDLIPVYPFAGNPGAIFQAYWTDSAAAISADAPADAGASGVFETADEAYPVHARMLYYIGDTGANYDKCLVMYIAQGSGG